MIYICVLNYANADDTMACCESLLRLTEQDFRILLIDNASPDGSRAQFADYAVRHPDRVVFFLLEQNRDYAAGNNAALRYALARPDFTYAWVLNNDTIVEPDALTWLVRYMEEHPEVGLCGSRLVYAWV